MGRSHSQALGSLRMKLDRRELLQRLLAVSPGIVKSGTTQSDCIVLRKGRFYTLSKEIACSLVSGLEPDVEGAVQADRLIELLKQMPDQDVDINIEKGILHLSGLGKARRAKIPMESEILLPVGSVELPKAYTRLSEGFAEAVDLVISCTKKRGEFLHECLHIHPKYIEASDNIQMARWDIETFVPKSVLVRGQSLKAITQLGMTKGAMTESWLHFVNPMGLRVSVCQWAMEKYPKLDDFLNLRGEKVVLPKLLAGAAMRAGIFAEEDSIGVKLNGDGRVLLESKCGAGEYQEEKVLKYDGPELRFSVPYKLIAKLVEKHNGIEVTECSLRVNGGKYIYATSLEMNT